MAAFTRKRLRRADSRAVAAAGRGAVNDHSGLAGHLACNDCPAGQDKGWGKKESLRRMGLCGAGLVPRGTPRYHGRHPGALFWPTEGVVEVAVSEQIWAERTPQAQTA